MIHRIIDILIALLVLCILGLVILSFSSFTATDCTALVLGGEGTVEDPLRIMVRGNSGLVSLIDDLFKFKSLPPIAISYSGFEFYVPMFNVFFSGNSFSAKIIYLICLLVCPMVILSLIFRTKGRRIAIVRSKSRNDDHAKNEFIEEK